MFNYDVIFKFWDGAFNYQGFIEKAKAIVFEIWALLLVQMPKAVFLYVNINISLKIGKHLERSPKTEYNS